MNNKTISQEEWLAETEALLAGDLAHPINQPWTPREELLMRRWYREFAQRGVLRRLAARWEELTGVKRSTASINNKARAMGLQG